MKPFLYTKKSANKGRAVFTKEKILANTIIEESPVIVMSKEERIHLDKTLLHDYIFEWFLFKIHIVFAITFITMIINRYVTKCHTAFVFYFSPFKI